MRQRPRVHLVDSTALGKPLSAPPSAIVLGNFDGVHRGHQAVIRQTVAEALKRGLEPAVLTFDPHPATVIAGITPSQLTSPERRVELVGKLGISLVYVCRFDRAFASLSAEQFAGALLGTALGARLVVVGANFRFGSGRSGDLDQLRRIGQQRGFEVLVHEIFSDAGGPYSSTRARGAVRAGDIKETMAVLGRPHAITGTVEHGLKVGRTLGFPTANLGGIVELLPPNGVYAVQTELFTADGWSPLGPSVMNIGVRPTLGGALGLSVEVHILETVETVETERGEHKKPIDLYGRLLRVEIAARLRDERKFSGRDALVAQIECDVAEARQLLLPDLTLA